MIKRLLIALAAVVVVVAALGFVKFQQIQTAIAQGEAFQMPPDAVTTIVAKKEEWPATLGAIGSVAAVQGVTVSADLPGIVEKIAFDSGRTVGAGQVLVELDASQERAQKAAAEADRELKRLELARAKGLVERALISQAEYDRREAEAKQAEARVREIEATIERKTIRAPFAGVLGIRQVNLGQYLSGGDPIVPLQSLDPIYVNFAVPQQRVAELEVGAEVELAVEGMPDLAARGPISAVNSVVDAGTRNIQVQATFRNSDARLHPGMFVEARVLLHRGAPVIALPASAIHYAPYGNSVFLVEDSRGPDSKTPRLVRQQFVELGEARGDQVAVLSGVQAGQEVVTSGVFKLRNGGAVLVNNEVQPGNNPAPRPEDS